VHVRAAHFPGSPLSLCFGRAGTHVKLFRWVICGRLCQLVSADHLHGSPFSFHFGRACPHVKSFGQVV